MTTIQQLHAEVWAFRREMEHYFPTPNQADSLAFAFTEIAEAVDATLRQNPVYKRNNAKEHSVERELAQCAIMLLTAIPEGCYGWDEGAFIWSKGSLSWVAATIGIVYDEMNTSLYEIASIVKSISRLTDLPTHLRAELARMRAKHGPVHDDGQASLNAVENEHVVYVPPVEGLTLAQMEFVKERRWTPEQIRDASAEGRSYTANDAGEWVIV